MQKQQESQERGGLSKSEISIRKKMAAKFGLDTSHLTDQQQSSSPGIDFDEIIRRKQKEDAEQPKVEKRKEIKIEKPIQVSRMDQGLQSQPRTKIYTTKPIEKTLSAFTEEKKAESIEVDQSSSSIEIDQQPTNFNEFASQNSNLDHLITTLKEYPRDVLEREIFVLHYDNRDTTKQTQQNQNSKGKEKTKNDQSQSGPIIVLNETQFKLVRKVYPKIYAGGIVQQSAGDSKASRFGQNSYSQIGGHSLSRQSSSLVVFQLHDAQMVTQFFANLRSLFNQLTAK